MESTGRCENQLNRPIARGGKIEGGFLSDTYRNRLQHGTRRQWKNSTES